MRSLFLWGTCTMLTLACSGPAATPPDGDAGTNDTGTNDSGTTGDSGGPGLLPVDCRNLSNLKDPACKSPTTYTAATTIGSGPHFVDTLDVVHRGFTDTNRIIAGLGTKAGGVILAVDVTNGNRTVISGPTVGTGTALPEIFDVQPGPDGWYALANGSVWRVDPATGNRTKVWDTAMGVAQCTFLAAAAITYDAATGGLAVGTDGTLYLPIITQQVNDLGEGLIAVKSGKCTLVSHTGYPMSVNHGTGPVVLGTKNQLSLRNGKVLALDGNQVGSIDLATGNRTVLSNNQIIGTGPALGGHTMAVTTDVTAAWTACGGSDGIYVKADLASGNRTGLSPYLGTPLSIGGPWCTIWMHPTQPLLVVEDANGFAFFDPSTKNSNVFSY